jgi:hypothetical protein
MTNGILYRAFAVKTLPQFHKREFLAIEKFENQRWGDVDATAILQTFFSSFMKKKIGRKTTILGSLAHGIKASVVDVARCSFASKWKLVQAIS